MKRLVASDWIMKVFSQVGRKESFVVFSFVYFSLICGLLQLNSFKTSGILFIIMKNIIKMGMINN